MSSCRDLSRPVIPGEADPALRNVLTLSSSCLPVTAPQAIVPYAMETTEEFLGHKPAKFVSAETAAEMATTAYRRAVCKAESSAAVLALLGRFHCATALRLQHLSSSLLRRLVGRSAAVEAPPPHTPTPASQPLRPLLQLRLAPPGADVAGVAATCSLASVPLKRGDHRCFVVRPPSLSHNSARLSRVLPQPNPQQRRLCLQQPRNACGRSCRRPRADCRRRSRPGAHGSTL